MKKNLLGLGLLCAVLAAALLTGCGSSNSETTPTETTVVTEPVPTTPPNGNPDDVTCLGSYTASEAELQAAADTVVATAGEAKLTLRQLQVYYWMEVATYRQSDAQAEPDYSQSLDLQTCPVDSSVGSWQQYFLKRALNTWHLQQALPLTE